MSTSNKQATKRAREDSESLSSIKKKQKPDNDETSTRDEQQALKIGDLYPGKMDIATVCNSDESWYEFVYEPFLNKEVVVTPFSTLGGEEGKKIRLTLPLNDTDGRKSEFASQVRTDSARVLELMTDQVTALRLTKSKSPKIKFPLIKPGKEKEDGGKWEDLASFSIDKNATVTLILDAANQLSEDLDVETNDLKDFQVLSMRVNYRFYFPGRAQYGVSRIIKELVLAPRSSEKKAPLVNRFYEHVHTFSAPVVESTQDDEVNQENEGGD